MLQCFANFADWCLCRWYLPCHALGVGAFLVERNFNEIATFNARIESIESKPAFRNAWRKNKKCLIPALGYYEWQTEQGQKQPYFVTSEGGEPLVFAGLWDQCNIGDATLKSCTIITTESKGALQNLHSRMPVLLSVELARQWLQAGDGKSLLHDGCLTDFNVYKVDKRVNNSRQEGEELIRPV